jgi:polyisoprenoid-binding protein YceI
MKTRLLAAALALAPALALAETASFKIDGSHTQTTFAVKHLVISTVRGEFSKVEGSAAIDDADLTKSSVQASIDVASVNTREPKRDAHLKSADFFDAEKFPKITFKSTKVEKAGEGALKVTGDLTIKGVTRSVVLDLTGPTKEIKDPWGLTRRGLSATTKINRKDFGVSWGPMIEAGPVVGDEVTIMIEAELIKDQPAKK